MFGLTLNLEVKFSSVDGIVRAIVRESRMLLDTPYKGLFYSGRFPASLLHAYLERTWLRAFCASSVCFSGASYWVY